MMPNKDSAETCDDSRDWFRYWYRLEKRRRQQSEREEISQ